ncbi:MAG: hypothetical protein Q8O43_02000 [Dehalococcoidia bacterium]|nr:hypothetical protein [Dehalococcoidia bacterium]
MPLSPREMEIAVIRNLPAKTGKKLKEWVEFTRAHGQVDKKFRLYRQLVKESLFGCANMMAV